MAIKYGCDVSKWNSSSVIKGMDFAIIRAGYGKNNLDPKFAEHIDRCNHYGIPYGIYWFSYALSKTDAIKEADYCVGILKRFGCLPQYPVYFDFEYDSARYFKGKTGRDVTNKEINDFTVAFCERLEELGYYAGVYCNKDYFKKYDLKGKYTIWLADYSNKEFTRRPAEIHMIQYTSKPFDKDVCRIDFPSIIKKNGLNGFSWV